MHKLHRNLTPDAVRFKSSCEHGSQILNTNMSFPRRVKNRDKGWPKTELWVTQNYIVEVYACSN